MAKERVYISGAITGTTDAMARFEKAENSISGDYHAINPAKVLSHFDGMDLEWDEYMKISIPILDICDAIYMLKGWESSKGAIIEFTYAVGAGKAVIFEDPQDIAKYELFRKA